MGYADQGINAMVDILIHPVDINDGLRPITGADETLGEALKKVTPSVVIVGIAMGGAAAIGSGAVNRWLWKR